jgi:hypothetical protein
VTASGGKTSPAVLEQLRDEWLAGDAETRFLVHDLDEGGLHRVRLGFENLEGDEREVEATGADYWAALEEALAQLPDEVRA